MLKLRIFSTCLFTLFTLSLMAQQRVDLLIVGGGAGGTSAAIQAARMGVRVQVIERTSWLGGMLTSAGVSAIDGNHELPSGIWGEFREKLRAYYGGAQALATGWVSHTLFEPSVGNKVLQEMASIPQLEIVFNAAYTGVTQKEDGWEVSYSKGGKSYTTQTKILVDATEIGELIPLVGAAYRLGMDSKADTGEKYAPEKANTQVQDLTYVALLEDVGAQKGRRGLVKKPRSYDPKQYACACNREQGEMFGAVSGCQQMLDYAKLPNNKYMINWPNCGNDFFLNWPDMTHTERQNRLKEAKEFTLGFIYYIQNELGFKNLRLANEFPTKDQLPMIPYDREARRIKGKTFLVVDHLEHPYGYDLYKTGIAVGDYPIDHHHDKNPKAPKIDFIDIKVPSYTIPMGALIPEKIDNFLVAEKNISVSNIVNGTTRLQPVVLGIGQAAGAIAASAILNDKSLSELSVRKVQNALIEHHAYVMPFIDVNPEDPGFASIQRVGATGVLKGFGIPYKWANQTWFYPERIVSEHEWITGLLPYYPELATLPASGKGVQLAFFKKVVQTLDGDYPINKLNAQWKAWNIDQEWNEETLLNRRTVSILTDNILDPFSREINLEGRLISP